MKKQEKLGKGPAKGSNLGDGATRGPDSNKSAKVTEGKSSTLPSSSSNPSKSGFEAVGPKSKPDSSSASSVPETGTVAMGMKHSKSDHSGLAKEKKNKSPMGKKFISKSSENLSSKSKGKPLSTLAESPRPRENAASLARAEAARAEKNKENLALKEKKNAGTFAKPKPVKANSVALGGIRKASSTQSIDKTSQSSTSLKSQASSSKSSTSLAIKRAQSTQNICKDKFAKKRTSAPADVMAYNAELLANFEKEKKLLEVHISEVNKVAESRKGEIEKYKYEVKRLKDQLASALSGSNKEETEMLRHQNKQLSDRLQELGFPAEQNTDTEKLLMKSLGQNQTAKSVGSNSDICVPMSASCDSLSTDGGGGTKDDVHAPIALLGVPDCKHDRDLRRSTSLSNSEPSMSLPDLCGTPDHPSVLSLCDTANWDKQSNKSANSDGCLSEASVACLTERILQMEETNYSTTEELQATLQELGDLQDAVNELTEENSRLVDEKSVLLESLCTQTTKLESTRVHLEQLKCLLVTGELPDKSDRDSHLLGLLKSAQEEREELLRKQVEWSNALEALETECKEAHEAGEALRDRFSLLEEANKALVGEKRSLEHQVLTLKEAHEAEHIEVLRMRTQLETERTKVTELETARRGQAKSEVETLLDTARQDKAGAEQRVADLTETLALQQCELARARECLATKEEEAMVAAQEAKGQVSELQSRVEGGEKARQELQRELEALRAHVEALEHDCDQHVEDKKEMSSKLSEVQSELRNLMQQKQNAEDKFNEMCSKHDTESEDWKQFQKDLQTAVVIANNLTQELQENNEQLTAENAQLSEQLTAAKAQADKLRQDMKVLSCRGNSEEGGASTTGGVATRKTSILTNAELKGKVLTTMDRELAAMREGGRPHLDQRSQSISVKSLIRSIEEHVKSGCSSIHSSRSESRRSSTSSDLSINSFKEMVVMSPSSPLPPPESPHSPTKEFGLRALNLRNKSGDLSPQPRHSTPGGTGTPGETSVKGRAEVTEAQTKVTPQISSILKDRRDTRRNSSTAEVDMTKKDTPSKDPLASLAKLMKGSKRNALLKWCQLKTIPYSNVDITNFSSSWNDGLGFCALLHSYVPETIPYSDLSHEDKRKNFNIAFNAGEGIGIKSNLNINDMVSMERPDWRAVMAYVTSIYKHFEVDKQ